MESVRDGDISCLSILFGRYHSKLFDYFFRMSHKGELSDDLVQDVFERVMNGRHTYKRDYPFVGWIFRIAKNVMMDHYRGRKIKTVSLDGYEMATSNEDFIIEPSEMEKALNQLTPQFREVLLLSRYEGLKYRDIAKIVGISETGVKSRVHRALKELKKAYEKIVEL